MNFGAPIVIVAGVAALAACTDLSDFGVTRRWAAEGLEFRAFPFQTELRMPCATVTPMPSLRVDSSGHFELTGRATHTYGSFVLIFSGQLVRDTIHAELTALVQGAPPHTTHYVLVPEGDPEFEHFACLG